MDAEIQGTFVTPEDKMPNENIIDCSKRIQKHSHCSFVHMQSKKQKHMSYSLGFNNLVDIRELRHERKDLLYCCTSCNVCTCAYINYSRMAFETTSNTCSNRSKDIRKIY